MAIASASSERVRPSSAAAGTVPAGRQARLRYFVRWAGLQWTMLYVVRQALARVMYRISRRMMRIEEARFLIGEMTVSAQFNTARDNSAMWNRYDWGRLGEEWSEQATVQRGIDAGEWKQRLVHDMLERYMPADSTLLEVGPGAGRWTEYLLPRSRRLILVDVAERCLELCRDRFQDPRLQLHLVSPGASEFLGQDAIPNATVDGIWSYDAFVHINPTDIVTYLRDFARVLKPGGIGVIHHTGRTASDWDWNAAFRSQMNSEFFAHLLRQQGLELVEQNTDLVHKPGDVITVFRKPVRSAP